MKLIIAGSRNLVGSGVLYEIEQAIASRKLEVTEVVSGGCRGVDKLGERYARERDIPIKQFLPDWELGHYAGPLRNADMAAYGDALLLVWDGISRGSKSIRREMAALGKPIYEVIIRNR